MRILVSIILSLICLNSYSFDLLDRAKRFGITSLAKHTDKNENIFKLGESLFFDKKLSGNKNISCSSCHSPENFSGDGLMLGLGQGRLEKGKKVLQGQGAVLKRHSPHVINAGYPSFDPQSLSKAEFMFWDGRVSYTAAGNTYSTPEPGLNGMRPKLSYITEQLDGALSAQALFPMLSRAEMRGQVGENEIADAETNEMAWKLIVNRVVQDQKYIKTLAKAFPETGLEDINIGHIAKAIGHFQKHFFNSTNTPLDRFMAGDELALSEKGKAGFRVFLSTGRCFACHNGPHLQRGFRGAAAPQTLFAGVEDDLGRGDLEREGLYFFKVPALRNVALTAPYFHNGAMATLEDVIEHYNDVAVSQANFELNPKLLTPYKTKFSIDKDPERNSTRRFRSRPAHMPLELSKTEKSALLHFLKVSLTDVDFKKRMLSYSRAD